VVITKLEQQIITQRSEDTIPKTLQQLVLHTAIRSSLRTLGFQQQRLADAPAELKAYIGDKVGKVA
jgi:hypothetical protein